MREYRGGPERVLRDHADDDGPRRPDAGAVMRIRDEEATMLQQLRTLLRS